MWRWHRMGKVSAITSHKNIIKADSEDGLDRLRWLRRAVQIEWD